MFNSESKFMQGMSRFADVVILNVLFLVTCLPIFTIGAAKTAMYTVCFRFGTDREAPVARSYFRAFKENFRQATLPWLFLLVIGATAVANTLLFYGMEGTVHYLFGIFFLILVLVLLIDGYVFPLMSQFRNDTKTTVKNALLLSVAYLPRTVVIVALNLLPFIMMVADSYLFMQCCCLWVFLYFAAAAYFHSSLLRKVFAPYMEQKTEDSAPAESRES